MEEWKDIPNYEGLYQASISGKIKNKHDRILKYSLTHNGYMKLCLKKENNIKSFRVHRLIYETFNKESINFKHIHHKDGDKTNNHLFNLECVEPSYNNKRRLFSENIKRKRRINERFIDLIETLEERYNLKTIEELKKALR